MGGIKTQYLFQDFVDVTLACADGSTLDAHKVILSSVSTYFRDILKVQPPPVRHKDHYSISMDAVKQIMIPDYFFYKAVIFFISNWSVNHKVCI